MEAEALLHGLAGALDADGDLLSDEERAELESVAGLVSVIEGDDIAAVRDRTDVLGQASLTFAERRMDRSIKSALSGVAVAELEASE